MREKKSRQDYSVNPGAVRHYEKALDRMAKLLNAYDIKAIFAYQPSLYFKEPKSAFEKGVLARESPERVAVLREMMLDWFPR